MLPDEGPGRGRGRDGDTSACTIYASDGGHVLRRTAVKLFIRPFLRHGIDRSRPQRDTTIKGINV